MTNTPPPAPVPAPPPGSAALLRLLDAVEGHAVVAYSPQGTISYFGAGAERLLGYKVGAVLQGADWRLLHGSEAPFADVFREGERSTEVLTRLGDTISVRTIWQRTEEGGWLALYRDETEVEVLRLDLQQARDGVEAGRRALVDLQRQAQGESRQSEKEAEFLRELLRHTIETIQIGLAVQEVGTGMIAYVNEGFEKIFGLGKLEVLGRDFATLLSASPEARDRIVGYVAQVLRAAAAGEDPPSPEHWELELPAGKKTVETYGRSIAVEGHPGKYILLIVEDHTERHRLQMQLVQSEKLAAIGQLAAGIAHEIRNPLNTIFNALFDLSEILTNPTPDVKEDIDISMEEIRRVQDIINNLLDFARESGRSGGNANPNEVLQKTLRLVQHDLTNRRIETHWDLESVPLVPLSENALKQILINLITNAAHAMPEGGRLTVRSRRRAGALALRNAGTAPATVPGEDGRRSLRLDSLQERSAHVDHVVLEITDTGTGIPPELLVRIFNPFFTTKEPGKGTGLGLAVVHSLVQDAGGAISVTSAVGKGTTFYLELPAVPGE